MTSYLYPAQETIALSAQQLISKKRMIKADALPVDNVLDEQWIRRCFLVDPDTLEDFDKELRFYSSAEFKYTDSSLGGNFAINPLPQFTRYADARVKGKVSGRKDVSVIDESGDNGMGHYYSEAYDDTAQVIHLRMGHAEFRSLLTFFTGFFSYKVARVARTGRTDRNIAEIAGNIVGMVAMVAAWPLLVASVIGTAYRFFTNKPSSKYCSFKPSMPLYWATANSIVNSIAINKGIFAADHGKLDGQYKINKQFLKELHDLMPDVFSYSNDSDSGGIDLYAVATRSTRKKAVLDKKLGEIMQGGDEQSMLAAYEEAINNRSLGQTSIVQAISRWTGSEAGRIKEGMEKDAGAYEKALKENTDEAGPADSFPSAFVEALKAEWDDGAAFASFRVDSTGPVSESFSNSIVESDLSAKLNSISSSAKSLRYSLSDGKIMPGLDFVTEQISSFVGGALDSINMSGLMALAGSAFVDIPKHWENSVANLPKSNYTMTLISPYGNPISQMIDIYIPLSMILAAALPLQTGRQSYTSPFLIQLYDRGRQQTRLGIIDSLSITRGTSNLAFNTEANAMAVEVSFSVADLSSVMTLPVAAKSILDEAVTSISDVFDDENVFQDYLNTLGSLTVAQQLYRVSIVKRNFTKKVRALKQIFSPYRIAMFTHDLPVVSWIDAIYKGTDRK